MFPEKQLYVAGRVDGTGPREVVPAHSPRDARQWYAVRHAVAVEKVYASPRSDQPSTER